MKDKLITAGIILFLVPGMVLTISVLTDIIDDFRPATEGQMQEIQSRLKHDEVSKAYVQSKAEGGISRYEYKLIRDSAYRYVKTKDTLKELGL